jgi:hypothetical protein
MAADVVGTLIMKGVKSGRKYSLSLFSPSGGTALNDYILEDWNAPAGAVSPNFFTVPEMVDCIDMVFDVTSGAIEFTSDGQRTAVGANLATFLSTTYARPVGILPRLQPAKAYRLLVTTVVVN